MSGSAHHLDFLSDLSGSGSAVHTVVYYCQHICSVHCVVLQLVRKGPSGAVQLVLLDHGLYRQIDDDFRREYAALWRALILADKQGIKRHAEGMNAGDAYP